MPDDELHRRLQAEAVDLDGVAHRALLAGDGLGAFSAFSLASEAYGWSWDVAPPGSYGRLVGRMKAAILSGDRALADATAHDVLRKLAADDGAAASPAAAWATAMAALQTGDGDLARHAATTMEAGAPAFARAAAAVRAVADGDGAALTAALDAIVADFATREDHLTGVAIADTALVVQRLGATRGLPGASPSPLLPSAT